MKKLFSVVCLLSLATLLQAQKIFNDVNAEARQVSTFTGISVSGGIDVYLSYGNEALAVSASKPEYRDQIKTVVEGGVLKVWVDSKGGFNISGNKNLRVYISFKSLQSLEATGGSDIKAESAVAADELVIRISGGSDFSGVVNANKLLVRQSGGSDMRISGKAGSLSVNASGGSDFKGYDLVADVCDLEASGASDIEITANRELTARASGASDIYYKGSPFVKEAKANGASSVKGKS